MYQKVRVESAVVAAGGTTSGVINIEDRRMAAITTPGTLTSTALTFTACDSRAGTFTPLYTSSGSAVSITVTTSTTYALTGEEADAVASVPFLKIVCGSVEAAGATFTVMLK